MSKITIVEEKERPEKATLIVDEIDVKPVTFPSGDVAMKLFIHGKIPEIDSETEMSNTDTGALWVKDDSTSSDIKVGSRSNSAMFLKIFKIKDMEKIKGMRLPLIQKPSKADPNRKFYVIDTST